MPDSRTQKDTFLENYEHLVSSSNSRMSKVEPCLMSYEDGEPWVEITEQPMAKGQRFRYKCEGRSAGSLPGETSTVEKKTFPTIFINNFRGTAAIVVVSCVTKDKPYRPHPHNLVGQDCKEGVCTLRVKGPGPIVFSNIGIQCCKRHDIKESLNTRKKIRVDPFATGIPEDVNTIDLNAVRLCFQVFLPDSNKKFTRVVKPVISQPIIDKKTVHDLVICRLSRQSGYAQGGDEVFLLCEKVNKDDIQVRFYQETEDGVCWEAFGEFTPQDIHRQYAIVFKTPPYKNPNIQTTVQVFIQLRRPSDDEVGDPKPFQYIPSDTDPYGIATKRKHLSNVIKNHIPTSVLQDTKDIEFSPLSIDPMLSNDLKMRLKRKAERGLQKKQNKKVLPTATVAKTEELLPEYSFVNTGGNYATTISNMPSTVAMVYDGTVPNVIDINSIFGGDVSFLSMLNATDGSNQQFTLTPISITGQMTDGTSVDTYIKCMMANQTNLSTDAYVIPSITETDDSRNADAVPGDGTVAAEECILESRAAEDMSPME